MKNQSLLFTCSLDTLQETQKWALVIAALLQKFDVLALKGNLGAGKTTFTRFLIQSLTSPQQEVPSPTFTLVQAYETQKGLLFHFDCYRLESPFEVLELGIEDAFTTGISLIEWPEKIDIFLPPNTLLLDFENTASRRLKIYGNLLWKERLTPLLTVKS
ncbi:MAG: tRNA (adenosine(37)-N6)-threonylcarbamoyltransferase complex ATPase subunit type 1 TsaE [Alphaproteobacteria bacterium 16-39-46]|nr:MAG: tRNA (adenosine(37)-N6)-threonylcarbamoyltransferase complex ATPase subunit type 1 TsaE [Rhodospirillales bacterium 35-44-4]OYZ36091.1 MAG: tRNA (adenosine(37)-N6)-threonylcarbamoyltransferase complex ATPase subunit type 1 TsaE [Alphaproteobacteria bacterium 16-39-46]OZA41064.1 MAG: tRNA (adenosine(37)-N6)-threonylcarbamoyltransferase complex ATPase subunit type 1 TsaE [Alphaproteobacteria bacterium 17-39-52]HQS84907.1 tRNA (adenosine(37)-N6)-threonylcarbamoyltransferase complex ATPase s